MKILCVGNGTTGIAEGKYYINNNTGYFLHELQGHDIKMDFCQPTSQYDKNNNLLNYDLKVNGIHFESLEQKSRLKSLFYIPYIFVSRLSKYNFYYLFFPGTLSMVFAFLCMVFGKQYGLYIRGQFFDDHFLKRIILRKAKIVLTVSPLFKEKLKEYRSNVEVIKPMVSFNVQDIKEKRNFHTTKKWKLLFVGRIEINKGIYELFDAIKVLERNKVNFQFDIVGGGDLFQTLAEQQKQGIISDNVKFHGLIESMDELNLFYENADCFVLPTYNEGFPRVLYEAMSKGLPIFTTMVGGIPGRMKNGYNCIEIPVKDGTKTGEVILESLKQPALMQSTGQNGIAIIKDVLSRKYLNHSDLLKKKIHELSVSK